MNYNMCIYSRLNPKLEGIDLGLLHLANISLTPPLLQIQDGRLMKP